MSDAATVLMGSKLLGLLEVFDRNGATVARLPVQRWPVIIGRALSADLVLDDGHIAAEHLRIDAPQAGHIVVQVLDTINGVRRGKVHYPRGTQFDWHSEDDLNLGRLRLRLRLPDMPIAAEQALPQSPWKMAGLTGGLVVAVMVWTLAQAWFEATDTSKFAQTAISLMGGVLAAMGTWAGAWALATKLFTGHPQFWRHVRIVSTFALLEPLVSVSAYLLAFMFSWESLARFNFLLSVPVLAVGVFTHLMVISPQRRHTLMAIMTTITVLGTATTVGNNWLQNKRATNQLYMAALFPPSWRVADTVPVAQFIHEADSIRARLQERLNNDDDTGTDEGAGEEE